MSHQQHNSVDVYIDRIVLHGSPDRQLIAETIAHEIAMSLRGARRDAIAQAEIERTAETVTARLLESVDEETR